MAEPKWISTSSVVGTTPDDIESIYFRRAFNCSTDPVHCPIIVHSVTPYKLYVNGRLVCFSATITDTTPIAPQTFDIREVLTWGENVIAVEILARSVDDEGRWRVPAAKDVALCLTGQMHGIVFDTDDKWKCLIVRRSDEDRTIVNDELESVAETATNREEKKDDEDDPLLGWKGTRFNDSIWYPATIIPSDTSFPHLSTASPAPRLELQSLDPAMWLSNIGPSICQYAINDPQKRNESAILIPPHTQASLICRVPLRKVDNVQTDRFIDAAVFASLEQAHLRQGSSLESRKPASAFVFLHMLDGSGAKIHLRFEDSRAAVTSQQRKKKTSIFKVKEGRMEGSYTEWEPFFARMFAWARLDVTTAGEKLAIMKFGIREILDT